MIKSSEGDGGVVLVGQKDRIAKMDEEVGSTEEVASYLG